MITTPNPTDASDTPRTDAYLEVNNSHQLAPLCYQLERELTAESEQHKKNLHKWNEEVHELDVQLNAAKEQIVALERKRVEDLRECEDIVASRRDSFNPEAAPANRWAIRWLDNCCTRIRAAFPDVFKEKDHG